MAAVEFSAELTRGTNRLYRVAGQNIIIKQYIPKRPKRLKQLKYRALVALGLSVPFQFMSEAARCAREREICLYWRACGYQVPAVLDGNGLDLPGPANECLVLEFIEGRSLGSVLADPSLDTVEKFALVRRHFSEMRRRHEHSLRDRDIRLVHFNACLTNVILSKHGLYYIDFETGRLRPVMNAITREFTRVALGTITRMGRKHINEIAAIIRREYGDGEVVRRFIKGSQPWWSYGRIFRFSRRARIQEVLRRELANALLAG